MLFYPDTRTAQIIEYSINSYTIEEGLSNNTTNRILSDSFGFIWITTENGLNRFDGIEITNYFAPDSIPAVNSTNFFRAIAEDCNGDIWLTAYPTGIYCYKRKLNKIFHFSQFAKEWRQEYEIPYMNPVSVKNLIYFYSDSLLITINTNDYSLTKINLYNKTIQSILPDKENNIWILTKQCNLLVFADSSKTIYNLNEFLYDDSLPLDGYLYITENESGDKFIVQEESKILCIFKNGERSIKDLNTLFLGKSFNLSFIFTDIKNRLWIANNKCSLIRLNSNLNPEKEFTLFKQSGDARIYSAISDSRGNIWAGTNSNGLYLICDNFVPYLIEDTAGNIWTGTLFGGFNKITKNKFGQIKTIPNKDYNIERVYSITFDNNDKLYLGTYGNGLVKVANNYSTASSFNFFKEKYVRQFLIDSKGNYWLGSRTNGLYYYNKNVVKNYCAKSFTDNPFWGQNILKIFEDSRNNIWVGTLGGGLYKFNSSGDIVKRYLPDSVYAGSVMDYTIRDILESSRNEVWILSGAYLQQYNETNDEFDILDFNSLDNKKNFTSSLFTFLELESGEFIIGAYGKGLIKYNPINSQLSLLTTEHGLASNIIYAMINDGSGSIWISTDKGLSQLQLTGNIINNYNASDGLQGKEYYVGSCAKGPDNKLYFGGQNGLTIFDPKLIAKNDNEVVPVFTKFKKNNKVFQLTPDISLTDTITISYYDKLISFEAALMNYTNAKSTEISYKLEGLNDHWIFNGNNREMVFTNLEPGEYTLKVRGANSDGIWNENYLAKTIIVIPPFWLTTWFKVLIVIVLACTIYTLYRQRIKRIETVNRLRLDKIKTIEEMRFNIASDLHDELGSTLGTISILSASLMKKAGLAKEIKSKIETVNKMTEKAAESMRDIIWFIKPGNNNTSELIYRMKNFAAHILVNHDYSFEINEELLNTQSPEFRRNIYLIFKESLHNIVKHSASSNVNIRIFHKSNTFYFTIADDGIGLKRTESFNEGNGLQNIRKRCDEIECSLDIETNINQGTKLIIHSNYELPN